MMKDMNNLLTDKERALLKSLLGEELVYVEHEKPNMNSFFQRLRLHVESGSFTLDNKVDWFDNYFAQPECIPHFVFSKSEDEMKINLKLEKFSIGETLKDVILIDDHLDVLKGDEKFQNWDSTEGVVFVTDVREYAYFKETSWGDELVDFFKGHHTLSKAEPVDRHWQIFGQPFNAKAKRTVLSLFKGTISQSDEVYIKGEED